LKPRGTGLVVVLLNERLHHVPTRVVPHVSQQLLALAFRPRAFARVRPHPNVLFARFPNGLVFGKIGVEMNELHQRRLVVVLQQMDELVGILGGDELHQVVKALSALHVQRDVHVVVGVERVLYRTMVVGVVVVMNRRVVVVVMIRHDRRFVGVVVVFAGLRTALSFVSRHVGLFSKHFAAMTTCVRRTSFAHGQVFFRILPRDRFQTLQTRVLVVVPRGGFEQRPGVICHPHGMIRGHHGMIRGTHGMIRVHHGMIWSLYGMIFGLWDAFFARFLGMSCKIMFERKG